jgi:Pentapeptide repeats (9 copies)
MDPTVVGAWIAAGVSMLTLIGTVITQVIGFRVSSRDAEKTAEEQRKQLDRTLAEQRTRTLNERFATAAEQLGSDKPAVQLAGVYAMAGLADDWEESRQTCVDVLCAYLQLPYKPDPGPDAPEPQRLAFQAHRKVRHTIIRVITAHLKRGAAVSWQGLVFGFNGVVFDGGDFRDAEFSGGWAVFDNADFSSGTVSFSRAKFSGGAVYFGGAKFSGGRVRFADAEFSGSLVSFRQIEISAGQLDFEGARFSGSTVSFRDAEFSGGTVGFGGAEFSGGKVSFRGAQFSGGTVDFSAADDWSVPPVFPWTDTPPSGVSLPKNEDQPTA